MSRPAGRATIACVTSDSNERARLSEYNRWLRVPSPSGVLLRWFLGEQGAFAVNTPVLRLPTELNLTGSERTLDIGTGRGALLRLLDRQLSFERDPVGLDFSGPMLKLAAQDEARSGRPSALVQATATRLPFVDGSFQLVLCGHLVKHLDDDGLRDLLDEIYRVLSPGGLALIWDFAPTGRRLLDAFNLLCITSHVKEPYMRSTAALMRFATEAGFPFVTDALLRPFLFPPIPRASVLIGRPPEEA